MKKRLMVDMDDVLVSGGFLYLMNEFQKTNYREEDFDNFYMQDKLINSEEFFKYFLTKNLYDYCSIKEGAREVLEELSKEYEIYICTAYIYKEIEKSSGVILKYKYDYLINNFPFIDPKNFIFTGDKSVVDCEIKIDDRLKNLKNADTKILFTAYHNTHIPEKELNDKNIIRVNNWNDIKELLLNKVENTQ